MNIRRVSAVVAAACGGLMMGVTQAADVMLKVHHFLPPKANAHTKLVQPWAKAVEEQSGGRIKVEIYPAMQLGGKPPQLLDQVRDGVADVVWALPGYTPGRYPIISVYELPFMITTAAATSQALQAYYERHAREEFKDIHPLFFHTHARGVFHSREKLIERMSDFDGLKMRGPNRHIGDALKAMGAAPIFMPVPALPEALSKGVVDGAVIPWEITLPLKVYELAPNHTEMKGRRGMYTSVFVFAMNKAKYDSLAPDLRKVIDDNSGMKSAKWQGEVWDQIEAPGLEKAKARGNGMAVLPEAEVEKIREATRPVTEAWIAKMNELGKDGRALYEEADALLERYSN